MGALAAERGVGQIADEQVREEFADEGIDWTMDPLMDPDFNDERSEVIHEWMAEKIQALPLEGFVELLLEDQDTRDTHQILGYPHSSPRVVLACQWFAPGRSR